MRFISHLDMLRLFQRALRRADLPLSFSQGYSPHIKLKIIPAIKLGLESDDLKAVIRFDGIVSDAQIIKRLKDNLPKGIDILEVK